MTVHVLCAQPPAELAQALARFEAQFTYPLGPDRFFRISHGDDYPRFFRAMGEAACFAAVRHRDVLGTVGAALRLLLRPDGHRCSAVYLGDLKIAPVARGGRTMLQLVQAVKQWVGSRAQVAFSVIMDGTAVTPQQYTGRLAIPSFQQVAKIAVLRVATPPPAPVYHDMLATSAELGNVCYERLSAGRYACPTGSVTERSETAPLWLMAPDGRACGRLEDTRRAKRLVAGDGREMRSAHLSAFAYEDVRAGVDLLAAALRLAAQRGFPTLFVAVAAPQAEAFCQALDEAEVVVAPATVFGVGLESGPPWNINTAEI